MAKRDKSGRFVKADRQPTYGTIVFMQGDDYNEFEAVLDERGEDAAFDHLNQWNYGEGYTDERPERPGENWHEHTVERDGQIMIWSTRYQYCGLFEVIP